MSQQVDPQGHAVQFQYPNYDPDTGIVLLKYVVDGDGLTTTVNYLADDTYRWNRVGSVSDSFSRTVTFGRADYFSGLGDVLTNIIDVQNISTYFTYSLGVPITMTTPYGTTSFSITDADWPDTGRSIIISEPNGSGQAYGLIQYCDNAAAPWYLPASYPSTQVPTNTPFGTTLDNAPQYRN